MPFEVIVHDPPRRHTDRSTGGPFLQEYTHNFEIVIGGERQQQDRGASLAWLSSVSRGASANAGSPDLI
jgi:hypothetical protein